MVEVGIEAAKIRVLPDGRVSRRDAATFLGRSPKTLADWKAKGTGPRQLLVGGRVFYKLTDLEAFCGTSVRSAA